MSAVVRLYEPAPGDGAAVSSRIMELRQLNREGWLERARIRDVMNSRRALRALVGDSVKDPQLRLPIANLMVKADETLARKLGRKPDTKVDPPVTSDSELAHKRAEKRARIVDTYDEISRLELLLPQVGRWLPGYGFVAAVVKIGASPSGDPYPVIELRDPFQTFPGEWGPTQEPIDMAVAYRLSRRKLAAMFPVHRDKIMGHQAVPGGGVVLGGGRTGEPAWGSQNGGDVDVYEYWDERGCWYVFAEQNLVLSFVPNVLQSPQFRLVKRFAFDDLAGAYEHTLGLMAMMARLSLLQAVAIEDVVLAETNIFGDLVGGTYKRGRNAVNVFQRGTTVQKLNNTVPFEAFQQLDRLEQQYRISANHSPQQDGDQGSGWTTGKGLEQLQGSVGLEVQEYLTSLKWWLRDLDSLRLETDQVSCDVEKMMYGIRAGAPFAEKYRPSADIKGDFLTRRAYGAMAGLDDASKIVGILQLDQAELIDKDSAREQIDGLENHTRIKARLVEQKAEAMLFETMLAQAQQGSPQVMQAAIGLLPQGDMRKLLETVFPPQPAAGAPGGLGGPGGPAPGADGQAPGAPGAAPVGPQDVQTVMSKLAQGGQASGSVRTSGALA